METLGFLRSLFSFYSPSLQMAVLEIQGNGESSYVPQEAISSAIGFLEDPLQRVKVIGSLLLNRL